MTEFLALLTIGEHWRLIVAVVFGAAVMFGSGWTAGRRDPWPSRDEAEWCDCALLPPMQDPAGCVCTEADPG